MSEHPALKNLYEEVINGRFKWERWGLLSVLCDYVLSYRKGNILEIGCGESSIHFSKLAEKHNRKCYHIEYSKSGVENMKNTKGYFGNNSEVFNMKSDDFFSLNHDINLSLSFIDGDHTYEQARRDFYNILKYTETGGYIFLHDTCPPDISWTVEQKCGTVYKLREEIEEKMGVYSFTFKDTAFGVGLTMVRVENGCC